MAETGIKWHVFDTRQQMVAALKTAVTAQLRTALQQRGKASWAVSGGSTPKPLFTAMSSADLDWAQVQVALVDDRWVDIQHSRSNEAFVKSLLAKDHAAKAHYVGMKTPHDSPFEAVAAVNERYRRLAQPFDSVLLGMGPDGHTASLFPGAQGLEAALDPLGKQTCVALKAKRSDVTGDELDRMSLSAPAIMAAHQRVLMITGDTKKKVLEAALGPALDPASDLPVGRLARLTSLGIYWAP
jgi:6-phosphogluconolactonase